MNWNNVFIIYKKEVLSFLKNKEALLVMLLVPLIIYPGIMLLTGDLFAGQLSKKTALELELVDISTDKQINKNLIQLEKHFQEDFKEDLHLKKFMFSIKVNESIQSTEVPTLKQKNKILLTFQKNKDLHAEKLGDINIYYDSRNDIAAQAVREIRTSLKGHNAALLKEVLSENSLSEEVLNKINLNEVTNIAPESHTVVKFGGGMIAITIMFLVYISCQYAATEVLPAEREQNTLETLLATPIEWKEIIVGKYFAIVSAGLLNALSNLAGIVLFGGSIIASMNRQNYGADLLAFSPTKVFLLLLTLIPLAFMCGSLALLLVSFAKTRMAASYYSLPGMLLVSIPAALALLPNTELSGIWYLVPFANITLYFRNLFLGDITVISSLLVFANIITFSGLLSLCSIHISHRKDQILSGGTNFSIFSRPKQNKDGLSLPEGMFICMVTFLLFTTIGAVLQSKMTPWSISASFWAFLIMPSALYIIFKKVSFKKFLKLYMPTPLQVIGTLLSLIPIIFLATITHLLYSQIVPDNSQANEMIQKLLISMKDQYGLFVCIFVIAITPGITEEFIFRGVLFSSLRKKYSWVFVVIVTGILFALVHGATRAIPIIPVGIYLGWLRYKTQSIVTVMIFHTCFNSVSIIQTVYADKIKEAFPEESPFELNAQTALLAGAIIIAIAFMSFLAYKSITSSPHRNFDKNEV